MQLEEIRSPRSLSADQQGIAIIAEKPSITNPKYRMSFNPLLMEFNNPKNLQALTSYSQLSVLSFEKMSKKLVHFTHS